MLWLHRATPPCARIIAKSSAGAGSALSRAQLLHSWPFSRKIRPRAAVGSGSGVLFLWFLMLIPTRHRLDRLGSFFSQVNDARAHGPADHIIGRAGVRFERVLNPMRRELMIGRQRSRISIIACDWLLYAISTLEGLRRLVFALSLRAGPKIISLVRANASSRWESQEKKKTQIRRRRYQQQPCPGPSHAHPSWSRTPMFAHRVTCPCRLQSLALARGVAAALLRSLRPAGLAGRAGRHRPCGGFERLWRAPRHRLPRPNATPKCPPPARLRFGSPPCF